MGKRSGDVFYARAAIEQSTILGCPSMVVPGHHVGFEGGAEKFVRGLQKMIEKFEEIREKVYRVGFAYRIRTTTMCPSLEYPLVNYNNIM